MPPAPNASENVLQNACTAEINDRTSKFLIFVITESYQFAFECPLQISYIQFVSISFFFDKSYIELSSDMQVAHKLFLIIKNIFFSSKQAERQNTFKRTIRYIFGMPALFK